MYIYTECLDICTGRQDKNTEGDHFFLLRDLSSHFSPTDRATVWRPPGPPFLKAAQGLLPGGAGVQPTPLPSRGQVSREGQSSLYGPASVRPRRRQAFPALLDHWRVQAQLRRQEQAQCLGPAGESWPQGLCTVIATLPILLIFHCFFEALLCVAVCGISFKGWGAWEWRLRFYSINASLPHAGGVCLKVVSAVGDLVCCEILMIRI